MTAYNSKEKKLAEFLRKFPALKRLAKLSYQKINYLLYRKKHNSRCLRNICKISYNENAASFFGYYDKSPLNKTGNYIILHSVDDKLSNKNFSVPADIIIYNIKDNSYNVIDTTTAYNWQQGCRLQWISDNKFIYNVFENGCYQAKIFDIEIMRICKTVDVPIYDCYLDKFALSVSFQRLSLFNADYGYFCQKKFNLKKDSEDGIFLNDLVNGKSELIYSLLQASTNQSLPTMHNADHLFNHIMVSPDGLKFIFIHRWYDQRKVRYDRLVMFNITNSQVAVLSDEGMVSHCCWRGNDKVVGYFKHKGKSGYHIIDILSGKTESMSDCLSSFSDGHMSFYNDYMICDTYPDKSRMQSLFLLDKNGVKLEKLGEFLAPFKYYGESRCDLHPKWSYDGKFIFIESTHEGVRKLYKIDLEKKS